MSDTENDAASRSLPAEFDLPLCVEAAGVEPAQEKLRGARLALSAMRKAVARAEAAVALTHVADALAQAPDLLSVELETQWESFRDGGSMTVSVACVYDPEHPTPSEVDLDEELRDELDEFGQRLRDGDMPDRALAPAEFMAALAKAMLGEEHGPRWLAAREAALIGSGVEPAAKAGRKPAL